MHNKRYAGVIQYHNILSIMKITIITIVTIMTVLVGQVRATQYAYYFSTDSNTIDESDGRICVSTGYVYSDPEVPNFPFSFNSPVKVTITHGDSNNDFTADANGMTRIIIIV